MATKRSNTNKGPQAEETVGGQQKGALNPKLDAPDASQGPLRVLRVITRLNIGGPARHTTLLSRGLRARGFETTLVTGSLGEGEGDMSYLAASRGAFSLEVVPALQRAIVPQLDAVALRELVRLCRRHRPHILHTHTSKAGLLGRVAGLLTGVPLRVHTFHGHIFGGYFSSKTTRLFLYLERILAATSHRILALSKGQRDDLSTRFKVCPRDKIQVVPLGFEHLEGLAAEAPKRRGELRGNLQLSPEAVVVGTVGRLVDIKGLDLFIDTAAHLHQVLPDVHFVIAGDGHLRSRLEQQALEVGLEAHVHFLGWRRDLAKVYADLDLFALTSHNEGTPVAVIEALAARVPVVATAVGGVPDVLEGGRLGVLVPGRDPSRLAAEIQKHLSPSSPVDTRHGLERPQEVSARIRHRYSAQRLLDDVERVYREGLSKRGPEARSNGLPRPPL